MNSFQAFEDIKKARSNDQAFGGAEWIGRGRPSPTDSRLCCYEFVR
jgi:hypothetical protein